MKQLVLTKARTEAGGVQDTGNFSHEPLLFEVMAAAHGCVPGSGRQLWHGDLRWCVTADIEPDRAVKTCQLYIVQSHSLQSPDACLLVLL
jgi:hypothetical protein